MKKMLLLIGILFIIPTVAMSQSFLSTVADFSAQTDRIDRGIDYTTNITFGGGGYGKVEFVLVYLETAQNGSLAVYKILSDETTNVLLYSASVVAQTSIVWAPTGNYLLSTGEQLRIITTGTNAEDGILQLYISSYK